MKNKAAFVALALVSTLSPSFAQFQRTNPFAGPGATIHYAPDRVCDMLNVLVEIKIDPSNSSISGTSTSTMSALRDGIQSVRLNAGTPLDIESVTVDGSAATFKRDGRNLDITTPTLKRGQTISVVVKYHSKSNSEHGPTMMVDAGMHWIRTSPDHPNRTGIWTQGETETNSDWAPMWDYPSDFVTSETRTTVPADWDVVGNGVLVGTKTSSDEKWKTYDWKMTIPHATYLISLCAGPFDIKRTEWRGVPLMYVVPKGEANLIDDSFGSTPDILSFYSDVLGFKFCWPKLAMDAMLEFGGGMENVSAITLQESALSDKREGFRNMDSLNAHEIAHQWFGDTVTCKDWGHIWLNESFATFMQALYFEHSRGKNGYDREIEDDMQGYFGESRIYKRPLDTNLYTTPDNMFDSHTYPKGGAILHTLRRLLGDDNFFYSLHNYLVANQHTPVDSATLCKAFTETTGINALKFWDQWINKPGHPVIDYSWKWDDASSTATLTVSQLQDTKDGTPIYDLPVSVGIVSAGKLDRQKVRLNAAKQDFSWKLAAKPDAVVFDPDHDFLREIPKYNWAPSELPAILASAPCCIDRQRAYDMLLSGTPSDENVKLAVAALQADNQANPALMMNALVGLKRQELRAFFLGQLNHPDFDREREAATSLGNLPPDPATTAKLRSLVNNEAPYGVVIAALESLARWDPNGNVDIATKAAGMPSHRQVIRIAAYGVLAVTNSPKAIDTLVEAATKDSDVEVRAGAIAAMSGVNPSEPRARKVIVDAIGSSDVRIFFAGVRAATQRKDKTMIPALTAARDAKNRAQFKDYLQEAIDALNKG